MSTITDPAATDHVKLSPVEGIKDLSRHLRGTINEELSDGGDGFNKDNQQLIKTHGFYQQDDRDARKAKDATGAKKGKAISFMVRSRVPGGKMTSEQMLAEIEIGDQLGNGTLRITTRQGLQLHGILKDDLQTTIRVINAIKLSTLAACGDVNRNVMCCPAPHANDTVHAEMQALADELVKTFAPRTEGYFEIWLRDDETGEEELVSQLEPLASDAPALTVGPVGDDVEPIYGKTYLPRKFKMSVGLPEDNCVDMYANDLSFMAIVEAGKIVGYNVLIGGGMGVTPSAAKTFPAVAKKLAYCTPEQAVSVAVAVVKVQRDFGYRDDRKRARLKYLVHDRGIPWFKRQVEDYLGYEIAAPTAHDVTGLDDHIGWRAQGDGKFYYGVNIENGRLQDGPRGDTKGAVREICAKIGCDLRLTAHQSIIFLNLTPADKILIDDILRKHKVPLNEEISVARRWSMACVAKPTCGLAVAESERALPDMLDQIDVELAKLGLSKDEFTLRMTGCPNGCARPYNCDIGLVGKTDGKYTIFVGGRLLGDRLNFIYKDLVPQADVVAELIPLFRFYKQARHDGETMGDFFHRQGAESLTAWVGANAVA